MLIIGAPDRIRTYDLRLRKPTLYPAELRVQTGNTTGVILACSADKSQKYVSAASPKPAKCSPPAKNRRAKLLK